MTHLDDFDTEIQCEEMPIPLSHSHETDPFGIGGSHYREPLYRWRSPSCKKASDDPGRCPSCGDPMTKEKITP